MVRQMVGDRCRSPMCGGNPDGGLGTDVEAIMAAIDQAWSEAGVAILVDLGGAETNSEMAIEMLAGGAARPRRRLQRADRRGRGDGGDRSLGRRDARRRASAPPKNCRRHEDAQEERAMTNSPSSRPRC